MCQQHLDWVVIVVPFYSTNPNSNPSMCLHFVFYKMLFEENETEQKEAVVGPWL